MPKFLVELEDGKKFQVEADKPPTQAEVSSFLGSSPVDSGQSLPSSMLSAVGRGAASVIPSTLGGVGYLTGSDALVQAGQGVEDTINETFPVNPIHQDSFLVKASGAGGQALSMLATGGLSGAITKSVATAGRVMLGQGFLGGAREGGQTADETGMQGATAYARILAGGATEVLSEKLPFGQVAELGPLKSLMGDSVEFGFGRMVKDIGTESVEGGFSQVLNNAADKALIPDGVQTPGLLDNVAESAALEGVGGAVFSTARGISNIVSGQQPPQQAPVPQDAPQTDAAVTAPTSDQPLAVAQPVRVQRDGRQFYRDPQGAWSEVVPPAALGLPPLRMLDPSDITDGTLIVDLESRASRVKPAAAPVVEPPAKPAPFDVETHMQALNSELPAFEGQTIEDQPDAPAAVSNIEDIITTLEGQAAAAQEGAQEEQNAEATITEPVVSTNNAAEILRKVNEDLPEAAKAKWTDDVYALAEQYFATGDESQLANLTPVQKRRVVQARLDVDQDAAAAQDKSDRVGEDRIRKQEKSDAKHDENTTFKNFIIDRDLESGFMSTAGVDAIVELAKYAVQAGTNFTKWAGGMLTRFGGGVKRILSSAWKKAIYYLPNDRIKNVRMGRAQGNAPVQLEKRGSIPTGLDGETVQPAATNVEQPIPTVATPSAAAQAAQSLSAKRTIIDGPIKALRDGFKQIQSALKGRTSDGVDVPNIEYDPRSDAKMAEYTTNVMDAMAEQGVAKADVLSLLQTGESPAFDFTLSDSERMILASHMLRSGRFSQFGVLRSEILQIMSDAASEAGGINREWQRVLDPVEKLRSEATTQAGEQLKKVTGKSVDESWDELEAALAASADTNIDAETRKAVARIRAKLEKKQTSQEVADAINALFFPENGKSLSQQLYEDGAKAIASAFFRGKNKTQAKGVLNEGADVVKGELSSLLNEALDALGIQKATKENPTDEDYKNLITQLGLGSMREGKMVEIDRIVRERINEYIEQGAHDFAEDLLDQWEQVSATMVDRSASTASLRRVINAQLAEQELNIRKLLAMPEGQATATMFKTVNDAINKALSFGNPEAGGLTEESIKKLRSDMQAAGATMIAEARTKAATRKAEREAFRNSPEEVTRRAKEMVDALGRELLGVKTDGKEWNYSLQTLVSDALTAEEDSIKLKDMAMDMGVSEEVAASLELMVLAVRRNRDANAGLLRAHRQAKARAKAILDMVDKLSGLKKNKDSGPRLASFLRNLQRADEYKVLDKDFFLDAFSHAFELNSLTPAIAEQLRRTWQDLNAMDANGRPKLYGMARETAENRFLESVNAVAPGARWDNLIFNQYQAGVLSSISSIFNQFSGIFRVITGVEAVSRTMARGDRANAFREWYQNISDLIKNMPLVLSGVRGDALGHLPPQLKGSFMPTEQNVANTKAGQKLRIRIGGSTITASDRLRKILRAKELWTWRTIRGAEAVSGITDSQSRFRDTLTEYYKKQGKTSYEAYNQTLNDVASTPEAKAVAEKQALKEQQEKQIGPGKADVQRRVEEIIARGIEERLGVNLVNRVEKLTAAAQFKSVPTGIPGFAIYNFFQKMASSDGPASRISRFFLLFGRFLGHTADSMLSYAPGFHLATVGRESESKRNKLIKEIYGDVNTYNRQQHGKAAAGTAFLLMNGVLMALAEWLADDEEPFFQIFGTAPMASRDQKEALTTTGKWREGTLRVFGKSFNYMQIPELAGLFTALGNTSDYVKFGQQLSTKNGEVVGADDAAFSGIKDLLTAPIKRSTYRQWFDAFSAAMEGRETDAINNLLTAPVGGLLRVPLVVDADKLYRDSEGSKDAKGFGQNFIRRIPFVHVGEDMFNSYGERMPGLGIIGMFPPSGKSDNPEVAKAATINATTGTVRGMPKLPEILNGELVTNEQRISFVTLAGRYYVESVLRNEDSIRRAFEKTGADGAKKIISNISAKANEKAKKELGLKEEKD